MMPAATGQQNIVLSDDRLAVAVATLAVATVPIRRSRPRRRRRPPSSRSLRSLRSFLSLRSLRSFLSLRLFLSLRSLPEDPSEDSDEPSIGLRGLVCGVL